METPTEEQMLKIAIAAAQEVNKVLEVSGQSLIIAVKLMDWKGNEIASSSCLI